MIDLSLEEIVCITGATLEGNCPEIAFTSINTDTRTLQPGELFIAIRGENFDGHDFIAEAAEAGCPAVLTNRPMSKVPEGCICLTVRDTRAALGQLARFVRDAVNPPLIAVTGSNGKTTTKEMIYHILKDSLPTVASKGNFNNEIGLPKSLLTITPRTRAAVMEIGCSQVGEMERLADIARPDIGVVTGVSSAHLGGFGSESSVAREKSKLIAAVRENGLAVINLDCPYAHVMLHVTRAHTATFAVETTAHFQASAIRQAGYELTFRINDVPFEIPGLGRHNVYNTLAAVAACSGLGIGLEYCSKRLLNFTPPSHRMEVFELGETLVIDDSYNANPGSMEAALKSVASLTGGQIKMAILGDMLEMGGAAELYHSGVGRQVAQAGIEVLWTIGLQANEIAVEAVRQGMKPENIRCFVNTTDCTKHVSLIPDGAIVLIKGSRGMHMESIVSAMRAGVPSDMSRIDTSVKMTNE